MPNDDAELPDLGGVSGGGLWLVEQGAPGESAILVGLHIGTSHCDGQRLARSVLIGNVLRLLADEQPAIAAEIYAAFPQLQGDEWAVTIP